MRQEAVLQRSLSYHPTTRVRYKGSAGRKKARPSSKGFDTRSFLNEKVETIAVSDIDIIDIELEKAYEEFADGLERFYKMLHRRFALPIDGKVSDRLCELIRSTEADLEKYGIELSVWRHEDDTELHFTLYHHVNVMDGIVFIFYVSPVETLKLPMSDLYKRYLKYMADCFGTNIIPDGSSNYYIDMVLNMMFDDIDDDDEGYSSEKKMVDFYSNEGYNIFKEINMLDVNPEDLLRDLKEYRMQADVKEIDMIEVMIDGMNILPHMSMIGYDFNPYNDGFGTNEGSIEICSNIAFVYCEDDGLQEFVLDSINNDCNCGLYPVGWNKYLHLDYDFSKNEFDFLMSDDSKQREFMDWVKRFYKEEAKFDKVWD